MTAKEEILEYIFKVRFNLYDACAILNGDARDAQT
jgi:hypothetical protein